MLSGLHSRKKSSMDTSITIYSDVSSDSLLEIEVPKKKPPPLIDLENEELILNVEDYEPQRFLSNEFSKDHDTPPVSPGDNPYHWTKDMIKFYNEDCEDEFDVEKLQRRMDNNPLLWTLSERDKLSAKKNNKKRRSYLKCWNCSEVGHASHQCREPICLPKCHMCGVTGHIPTSCPNSICLNCGNQMNSYVNLCRKCTFESQKQCSRCHITGHHFINCSDNWRRYHSTVGQTDVCIPTEDIYKSLTDMWCCNCARKGHNQIHCQLKKSVSFPDTLPFVTSYETSFNIEKSYNSLPGENKKNVKNFKKYNNPNRTRNMKTELKCMKNMNKVQHSKKNKKRKKKKVNNIKRILIETPDFIPL